MAMLSMLKTELQDLAKTRKGGKRKNEGGEKEEKQRRREAQKVARPPARNTLLTEGQARL